MRATAITLVACIISMMHAQAAPRVVVEVLQNGKPHAERTILLQAALSSHADVELVERAEFGSIEEEASLSLAQRDPLTLSIFGADVLLSLNEAAEQCTVRLTDLRIGALITHERLPSCITNFNDTRALKPLLALFTRIAVSEPNVPLLGVSVTRSITSTTSLLLDSALRNAGLITVEREKIEDIRREQALIEGALATRSKAYTLYRARYLVNATENDGTLRLTLIDTVSHRRRVYEGGSSPTAIERAIVKLLQSDDESKDLSDKNGVASQ